MAGKPIPTALKVLRGNPGRRKLNRHEPKPQLGAEYPGWLADLGDPSLRQIWDELADRLNRARVLTDCDGEALAQLTHKVVLYRKAAMALKDGSSYQTVTETGAVMQRAKPEVAMLSDLGKQIRGLLSDFGMNPSARTKVSTVGAVDPGDPFTEFFGSK